MGFNLGEGLERVGERPSCILDGVRGLHLLDVGIRHIAEHIGLVHGLRNTVASRCNGQAVTGTECHVRRGVPVEDIWSVVDTKGQAVRSVETEIVVGRPKGVH